MPALSYHLTPPPTFMLFEVSLLAYTDLCVRGSHKNRILFYHFVWLWSLTNWRKPW